MADIILESERLYIRPLSINELINIKNKKIGLLETPVLSQSLTDDVITAITKKIEKMRNIEAKSHIWYTYWLIIYKANGNGIGYVGFKGVNKDGYTEVGYSVSVDYRKKGIMTEALKLLISWAYDNEDLRKITAAVNKSNIGSINVLKNCRFKLTGSSGQEVYYCLEFR